LSGNREEMAKLSLNDLEEILFATLEGHSPAHSRTPFRAYRHRFQHRQVPSKGTLLRPADAPVGMSTGATMRVVAANPLIKGLDNMTVSLFSLRRGSSDKSLQISVPTASEFPAFDV
jgi:hypothetical protein